MIEEKIKWDKKYKNIASRPVSPLLSYVPKALKGQKALDLAGGLGQNAKELCKKGYDVTLIDISDTALEKIKDTTFKKVRLDLDNYIIPQNEYDVIIMIKYFNLDILRQIPDVLKGGGFFVFETIPKYPVKTSFFLNLFQNFETIYFCDSPFTYVGKKSD